MVSSIEFSKTLVIKKMPRSHGKLTTTSSSAQTIHPWYYVPGDKYSTEKRLASKHESNSNRQIQNERINKYYR